MGNELLWALIEAAGAASLAVAIPWLAGAWLRPWLGSRATYGLWLCVPVAVVAVLLPPFAATPVPGAAPDAMGRSALAVAAEGLTAQPWPPFATVGWLLGAAAFATALGLRQRRYLRSLGPLRAGPDGVFVASRGQHLPAVIGAWRPRLVIPADFACRHDASERELILAHERVHLRRGDPWAKLLAAAIVCLNWFNPVLHLAWRRFRRDQELACDAAVLAQRPGCRWLYANALLRAHGVAASSPLGCHWRSPHPLTERVAQLGHRTPGPLRMRVGLSVMLLAVLATGYAAWAAQPRVRFADEAPLSPSAVAGRPADASAGQRHDGNGRLGALAAPAYPGAAYAAGQSGQVVVLVNVDARGLPTQVEVERSEPAGVFDAATLEAARRWRFTPPRRAGQAVASRVRVPVTFVLESSAAEAPAASQGVPDGIEG